MDLKDIGVEVGFLVSGLFGAILMVSKTAAMNLKQTVVSVLGGMMAANYLTPIVIELVGLNNTRLENGLAFIIGFLGLKIVEVVSEKLLNKIDNKNGSNNKRSR